MRRRVLRSFGTWRLLSAFPLKSQYYLSVVLMIGESGRALILLASCQSSSGGCRPTPLYLRN